MNDIAHPQAHRINGLRDTSSEQTQQPFYVTLFVYGTLMRGYWNHDRYCRNAVDIRPATTWGRLYALPVGYPALEIPDEKILAQGTADPMNDAATQARISGEIVNLPAHPGPLGDWDLIHGELITLADPGTNLPPIDCLEGFSVGKSSLYRRILTPAFIDAKSFPAWVYVMQSLTGGIRLKHGRWSA